MRRSSKVDEKKSVKHVSYYKELDDVKEEEEEEYVEVESVKEDIICSRFNQLPEDTINIILEYLPYNTRLAILKRKYNRNYIKSILKNIPQTVDGLTKIWRCADIAAQLLTILESEKRCVFTNLVLSSVRCFKKEKNPANFSKWYIESFTKIIIVTIKHYTIIYKKNTSWQIKNIISHIEQIILHIFAHLVAMQ